MHVLLLTLVSVLIGVIMFVIILRIHIIMCKRVRLRILKLVLDLTLVPVLILSPICFETYYLYFNFYTCTFTDIQFILVSIH